MGRVMPETESFDCSRHTITRAAEILGGASKELRDCYDGDPANAAKGCGGIFIVRAAVEIIIEKLAECEEIAGTALAHPAVSGWKPAKQGR